MPAQDSTFDQLMRLVELAHKNGLYDAADWLIAELQKWSEKWKHGSKKARLLTASPWKNDPQYPNFQRTAEVKKSLLLHNFRDTFGTEVTAQTAEAAFNDNGSLKRRPDYDSSKYLKEASEDDPICICGHTRIEHDERGLCDICGEDCAGFDPKEGTDSGRVRFTPKHKTLGSFDPNDNVIKDPSNAHFLTEAEAKQAFYDKVAEAGGHYIWEANGDQAVIISPDHDVRVLRFEDAQPFWAHLFELEEQIEDPNQLLEAIDKVCAKYFETPIDPKTYFYEPKTSAEYYNPNATGYTNEPNDPANHQRGSRNHIGAQAPGSLHNRIEKASEELASLWPKSNPAQQRGYAIAHSLHSAQKLLETAMSEITAYPELASQKISQAESALRDVTERIKHLKL